RVPPGRGDGEGRRGRVLRRHSRPGRGRPERDRAAPGPAVLRQVFLVALPAHVQTREIDIDTFAIGFDHRDRARLHELWDEALDTERWSEGELTGAFEAQWAQWNGLPAVAFGNWTGAALAALEYAGVRGEIVLCPSNTFMAAPLV